MTEGLSMGSPLPPDETVRYSPPPNGPRASRRRRGRLGGRGISAVVVVLVLVAAGCVAYFHWAAKPNWLALGKQYEVAANQHDPAPLTGPVSALPTMCTTAADAVKTGPDPKTAGKLAVQQWVQGCETVYHQDHAHQLVQDGVMYGNGAKPCTGACQSKTTAAGKSIALAASVLPGLSPASGTPATATAWCAGLMSDRLSYPLTASVDAKLKAGTPAPGPAIGYWDQGCEAAFQSVLNPAPVPNAVNAPGMFGKAPKVTFPAGQPSSSLIVKTLIQGAGPKLTSSDGLVGNYVTYDWSGDKQKLIGSSYSSGSPMLFVGQLLPGLETALVGKRAGSRILVEIPPADGSGSQGDPQNGVGPDDTLVFVVDMDSTFGTAAVPGKQTSTAGGKLPTVTPPPAGSTSGPAITIPSGVTAPSTFQVKTLITGAGAVVKKGESIAIQDIGVIWRNGSVFQSSWAEGSPFTITIGVGQVIHGLDAGLVGQTVGSRVLLVMPPAEAYGSAGAPSVGIDSTDTLVMVIDILAAALADNGIPGRDRRPGAAGLGPFALAADPGVQPDLRCLVGGVGVGPPVRKLDYAGRLHCEPAEEAREPFL
jgi:FKBP-type peptidyl-prolyl cis-trans isomerase